MSKKPNAGGKALAPKDLKRTKQFRLIRDSVCAKAGVVYATCGANARDLVDQYMELWCISQKLQADIDERGVSVYWSNGPSQHGYRKNDSVGEKLKVLNQMVMIARELDSYHVPAEGDAGSVADEEL